MGKRQAFIDLYRSGKGTRQKYIDLANSFRKKSLAVPIDPFRELTIHELMMSGALPSELKHGGIASLAPRKGYQSGKTVIGQAGDILTSKDQWSDLLQSTLDFPGNAWDTFMSLPNAFKQVYLNFIQGGGKSDEEFFKSLTETKAKGGLAGILNL
jgi:hypothetical protein